MKPTVQNPDFYQVANDYVQAPLSSFFDVGPASAENYQDGIYTQLAASLASGAYSAAPWKNPAGFNKRIALVNPSASYSADDYAAADAYDNV